VDSLVKIKREVRAPSTRIRGGENRSPSQGPTGIGGGGSTLCVESSWGRQREQRKRKRGKRKKPKSLSVVRMKGRSGGGARVTSVKALAIVELGEERTLSEKKGKVQN